MNNDNKNDSIDTVEELTQLAFQSVNSNNENEIEVLDEGRIDTGSISSNSNVQSSGVTNDVPVKNNPSINNNIVNNVPITNNINNPIPGTYVEVPVKKKNNILKIVIPIFILVVIVGIGYIFFARNNSLKDNINKSGKERDLSSLGISGDLTDESVEKLINEKIVFYKKDDGALNIIRFVKYNNSNVIETRRLKTTFEGKNAIYEYPYKIKHTIKTDNGVISDGVILDEIKKDGNKLVLTVNNEKADEKTKKLVGEYIPYNEDSYIELPFYNKGEFSGEYYPSSSERKGKITALYDEENDWYILYGKITREGKAAVITGSVQLENNEGVTLSNLRVSFSKDQLIVNGSGYEELDWSLTGGYLRNNRKKLIEVISYIDDMLKKDDIGTICTPCEK